MNSETIPRFPPHQYGSQADARHKQGFRQVTYAYMMENFFGLLKSELLYLQDFDSLEHFR